MSTRTRTRWVVGVVEDVVEGKGGEANDSVRENGYRSTEALGSGRFNTTAATCAHKRTYRRP